MTTIVVVTSLWLTAGSYCTNTKCPLCPCDRHDRQIVCKVLGAGIPLPMRSSCWSRNSIRLSVTIFGAFRFRKSHQVIVLPLIVKSVLRTTTTSCIGLNLHGRISGPRLLDLSVLVVAAGCRPYCVLSYELLLLTLLSRTSLRTIVGPGLFSMISFNCRRRTNQSRQPNGQLVLNNIVVMYGNFLPVSPMQASTSFFSAWRQSLGSDTGIPKVPKETHIARSIVSCVSIATEQGSC